MSHNKYGRCKAKTIFNLFETKQKTAHTRSQRKNKQIIEASCDLCAVTHVLNAIKVKFLFYSAGTMPICATQWRINRKKLKQIILTYSACVFGRSCDRLTLPEVRRDVDCNAYIASDERTMTMSIADVSQIKTLLVAGYSSAFDD